MNKLFLPLLFILLALLGQGGVGQEPGQAGPLAPKWAIYDPKSGGVASPANRDVTAVILKWNMADITPRALKVSCGTCRPTIANQNTAHPVSVTLSTGVTITIELLDSRPGVCELNQGDCREFIGCTTYGDMRITTSVDIKVGATTKGVLVRAPGGTVNVDLVPIMTCGASQVFYIYDASGATTLASPTYACSSCQ